MKSILHTSPLIIALFASSFSFAEPHKHTEEKHHDHEKHAEDCGEDHLIIKSKAGFSFEVSATEDRKARIVFLDENKKPLPLAEQKISGIAGERSAPTKLTFSLGKEKDAKALISDQALPSSEHIPMILIIQITAEAKAVTERFELHLH